MKGPDLSRRSFLGGTIVATACLAVGVRLDASGPMIWGDGVRDDTAGLQALLSGRPFRCAGGRGLCQRQGGKVLMQGGTYRLSGHLVIDRETTMIGCHFDGRAVPDARSVLEFKGFQSQQMIGGVIRR